MLLKSEVTTGVKTSYDKMSGYKLKTEIELTFLSVRRHRLENSIHAGVIGDEKEPRICFKIDLKVVNEIICHVCTCVVKVMAQEILSSLTFPHDICSEGCVDTNNLVVCLK